MKFLDVFPEFDMKENLSAAWGCFAVLIVAGSIIVPITKCVGPKKQSEKAMKQAAKICSGEDVWGNDFIFSHPPATDTYTEVIVSSKGPDEQENTSDDIVHSYKTYTNKTKAIGEWTGKKTKKVAGKAKEFAKGFVKGIFKKKEEK